MKAVLFDMDGVLIDSETFYMNGMYKWMKEAGFKGHVEDVYVVIGTTMKQTYEIIQKMFNFKYSIKELEDMNNTYFNNHPLDYKKIMIPGSLALMRHLKSKGVKLAVCSSSPKDNIDHQSYVLELFPLRVCHFRV